MADSMRPAQTNGIAKEVEPANEAIEEAGTSSGPIPSEEPAKSDEGVTCGAESDSDVSSEDDSSTDGSVSDERVESDFYDFSGRKKTFLERIQKKELTPDKLMKLILRDKEEVNKVEKGRHGYGAIHYISEGKHEFKRELLVVLAIHGGADLDLTTTHKEQMTALHLAIEAKDEECVKTLISLGADFNKEDGMGRTPLDLARMTARQYRQDSVQLKQFEPNQKMEVGGDMIEERGLTRTVDFSDQSTISFNLQMSYPSTQKPPDRSMIDLLLSVGATTGSVTSPEENHIFPLLQIDTKRAATADLTYEANQTATPSSSLSKLERDCNSENYCKCYNHLDGQISKRLKDLSHTLTPQEALDLVGDMREREQFRRKYGSRILCLDGGGIRGLVSLCILQEIERRMKMSITEIFDWIVGTSTGGIIALGLCYGPKDSGPKSVRQLRDLYWAKKNNVFGSSSLLLKNSEEASKELESTLKEWLGEDVVMQRTSECDVAVSSSPTPKPRVLIPAVHKKHDLDLHFFNNCFSDQYCGELVWKVARYTSAAFLYFTEFEDYIDGGILANNPAEEGLTTIQNHYHERDEKLPISLLVSVGSGINPELKEIGSVKVQRLQAVNLARWKNLIQLLVAAVMNKRVHSNCECRCREQGIDYFRFNLELDNGVDSDQIQTKILLSMLWETKKYLHREGEKMDELIKLLKQSSFRTP